ncbi:uncharacterized protein LOC143469644 [Clavelina lepadiformis]|uniref:Carboxypeptidase n=1 Tax=Clavelina lepadiformis TaxID=159417 RepID=A0ABP0F5S0_CLALP
MHIMVVFYKMSAFAFIFVTLFVKTTTAALINDLPGLQTPVNFKQYSGYITVDPKNGTRLFYWYVESQNDTVNDPLVLWLNGGPGCSSLGGFLGELGPFYVKPDGNLGLNNYSWNRIANVLFLESPAGVGFSKTDKPIPYNDEKTASDSFVFLQKFFEMYPHLQDRKFWITGESYAGHYIPTLATKIVEHNKKLHFGTNTINLQGLMIGNPLTVASINAGGTADYLFDHDLISNETHEGIRRYCNYTFPDVKSKEINIEKCNQYEDSSTKDMGNINPYDIYADVCLADSNKLKTDGEALLHHIANSKGLQSVYANNILRNSKPARARNLKSPYYPCQDNFDQTYLNRPDVQKAIHAETTKWADCSDEINVKYSKEDFAASMLPYYTNHLLGNGLKVLIYSGDVDSVVPATSTRRWLAKLNLTKRHSWRPWTDSRGQVGGHWVVYDELVYSTVRNAGHEVPAFQPQRAYDMFSNFLRFQD